MKKTTIFVAALLLAGTAAVATADNDIGCGLGTQLWEGQSGLAPKVLGATTNGTSGNQTFGITTGTLGCEQGGVITADARLRMFAGANLDNLARDMARGEGETLEAFAHLMKVSDEDKPHFFQFARAHFDEIFASERTSAGEMLTALTGLMARDQKLSVYVAA